MNDPRIMDEQPVIVIRVKADHWWQVMLGPLLSVTLMITVRTDKGYQDLPLTRLAPGDVFIVEDALPIRAGEESL